MDMRRLFLRVFGICITVVSLVAVAESESKAVLTPYFALLYYFVRRRCRFWAHHLWESAPLRQRAGLSDLIAHALPMFLVRPGPRQMEDSAETT
ncbi:hypothetical protein V8C44DRAFT_341504 [Trichoderma aethiopicum]